MQEEELKMQEIDQEKLIETVRSYEALYAIGHSKYSNIRFKETCWKEIGKKLKQPAAVCKKTWSTLRDSFRRALKKKREVKSGKPGSKIKKWKFEEEMSFLIPHLQEKETCNIGKDTDDNNDNEVGDNNEDKEIDRRDKKDEDKEENEVVQSDDKKPQLKDEKLTKKKGSKRKMAKQLATKIKKHKFESKPKTIKYYKKGETIGEQNQEPNAIDTFFSSIATTVKSFSPYYKNIAKSEIFKIITDLEMKQIIQSEREKIEFPSTSVKRSSYASISTAIPSEIMQSHHTPGSDRKEECSSPAISSHSSSTNSTPTPTRSYHFPCSK